MKKSIFAILILAALFSLPAQETSHFEKTGRAEAAAQEDAVALATRAALGQIITDPGLLEIFIADWYQQITITDVSLVVQTEESITVDVTVRVDPTLINLAEQKYAEIILRNLNTAEEMLAEVEAKQKAAETEETNGRLEQTFILLKQAQTRLEEMKELIRTIANSTIQSDYGYTKTAILERANAMETSLAQAFARLESYAEKAASTTEGQKQQTAYQGLQQEQLEITAFIDEMMDLAPFYNPDLRPKLEGFRIDTEMYLERIATSLVPAYNDLRTQLPADQEFLSRKIDTALMEIEAMTAKLKKIDKQLETEIRDPYIVRQERKRRSKENWNRFFDAALFARSGDHVRLRYDIPFYFATDFSGVAPADRSDLSLTLESHFPGLWLKTGVAAQTCTLSDYPARNVSQNVGLAFGRNQVFGVTFEWDWVRDDPAGIRQYRAGFLLGGVDPVDASRLNWLLGLNYLIPQDFSAFLTPYHINAALEFTGRVSDVLVLELRGNSYCLPYRDSGVLLQDLAYLVDWHAGVGFRLPKKMVWGIRYGGHAVGLAVNKGNDLAYSDGWQAWVEYSY